MSKALYEHHRLEDSARQIRLLELDAKNNDEFGMIVTDLEHAPQYAAVSYTWGESLPTRTITVEEKKFHVTGNAKYALEQVVPRAVEYSLRYIWIDTVCIDQSSVADKNSQVALMGDIYAGATKVFACIGAHEDGSDDVLKAVHSSRLAHPLRVSKLSHRPYWTRVWIVQELFQANSTPIVLCGKDAVSLTNLLSQLSDRVPPYEFTGAPMSTVIRLCVLESRDGLPFQTETFQTEKRHHLGDLIEQISDSTCVDPRDHIFGLLSMVDWPKDLPILAPNYRLTLP